MPGGAFSTWDIIFMYTGLICKNLPERGIFITFEIILHPESHRKDIFLNKRKVIQQCYTCSFDVKSNDAQARARVSIKHEGVILFSRVFSIYLYLTVTIKA